MANMSSVLVDAFNADQNERYNKFRRVKLKKETVRKVPYHPPPTSHLTVHTTYLSESPKTNHPSTPQIANQTLSQSVPPSVITTINGYTKVFIGTLVERAREIQAQHASPPTSPPPDQPSTQNTLPLTSSSFPDLDDDIFASGPSAPPPTTSQNKKPPRDLGPLLPDHFREALRRYKRDGEGGGAGLGGLSLGIGLQGTAAARIKGKRLFR